MSTTSIKTCFRTGIYTYVCRGLVVKPGVNHCSKNDKVIACAQTVKSQPRNFQFWKEGAIRRAGPRDESSKVIKVIKVQFTVQPALSTASKYQAQ